MIVLGYLGLIFKLQVLVILWQAERQKRFDLDQVKLMQAKVLPCDLASALSDFTPA